MNKSDLNGSSRTNWEQIDALQDEEIDTSDIPALGDDFFQKAQWRRPGHHVAVRVDEATLAWFRSQGEDCDERMAAALKVYAEAHDEG